MDRLPNKWHIGVGHSELERNWDEVAELASTHMGERDHRLDHPKVYVHPIAQRLGIAQAPARPKIRAAASIIMRSWANGEWKMPRWIGNVDQPDVVAVLKIVHCYNWSSWVLENRHDVPVIHVVRHPGGRHDSFSRRYVSISDEEETRLGKIEQLRELVNHPEFGRRIGPVDDLTLEEAETWFGVYQMEVLERSAAKSPRYLRIRFEDMVMKPRETLQQIYDHLGLPLTADVMDRIEARSGRSVFGEVSSDTHQRAYGWRDSLDADVLARITSIVDNSWISQWWADDPSPDSAAA